MQRRPVRRAYRRTSFGPLVLGVRWAWGGLVCCTGWPRSRALRPLALRRRRLGNPRWGRSSGRSSSGPTRHRQPTNCRSSSRPTTARPRALSSRARSIRRHSVQARSSQAPTFGLAAWMQRCGVTQASSTSPTCCRRWSLVGSWPPATAMPTQAARCASSSTTPPM